MKSIEQTIRLAPGDVLILIDAQNHFLSHRGYFPDDATTVIPVLNAYLLEFARHRLPIFDMRYGQPICQESCQSPGAAERPGHCVSAPECAEFNSDLILPPWTVLIPGNVDEREECLSSFENTALEKQLHGSGARRLFIGGWASRRCLLNTARDALALGFTVCLLRDATRTSMPRHGTNAEVEMWQLGAMPISLNALERISGKAGICRVSN